MGFLGVYTALYDYVPQSDQELAISEGDILYVLEKSKDDDWWKAKKRASSDDDDEPTGLIPNNYIEEARPSHNAKALYDYTRQTDEELSFSEDDELTVYDSSDPDWTLVGHDGEFGFVPANYIEITTDASPAVAASSAGPAVPSLPARPVMRAPSPDQDESQEPSPVHTPASALAGIISKQHASRMSGERQIASPPLSNSPPSRGPQFTPEASDEDTPPPNLPRRPPSEQISPPPPQPVQVARSRPISGIAASPSHSRISHRNSVGQETYSAPGGFHLYNISEMVSVMGKNKKLPTTLGLNAATGTIMIAPEKARDGPQQEWTADKLTHYSIEGKHVFMELVRPSKSVDFHAGAKDTAHEIVSMLGEISGAVRAEGLREVLEVGSGSGKTLKKGKVLYDFLAQGDDEVTVGVDDDVVVLDDTKSEEWWMVRRLKNGKEGVVPSSFIELTGLSIMETPSNMSGINAGKSTVEQNRLEEERLAKEAAKAERSRRDRADSDLRGSGSGIGVKLPTRGSSMAADATNGSGYDRSKKENRSAAEPKKKPNSKRIRSWTDRSGTFTVDAEFLGLKDGKIHLHKVNGVKIAVPINKMSTEAIEIVEKITGKSLDEEKPLSDRKKGNGRSPTGISVEKNEYDWFQFFLDSGVGVHECERYARNFQRDSMDEAILPEITPAVLRNLGLKEGDTLRVMKYLDTKYNRTGPKGKRNVSFGGAEVMGDEEDGEGASNGPSGGLFSGPGGTLRNNTRKGRPAPAIQTTDVVDADAFKPKDATSKKSAESSNGAAAPTKSGSGGFDDDAWDVKPSKQQAPQSASSAPAPAAVVSPPVAHQPSLKGSMKDLSLLSPPLQPTPAPAPVVQAAPAVDTPQPSQPQQTQQPQLTGANPSFFSLLSQQPAGVQNQNLPPRQRPQPPAITQLQGSLAPPPPQRPLSAPQNMPQNNNFGPPPIQPQLTGFQPTSNFGQSNFGPQVAPPGQSLSEINQQRLRAQFPQQQLQQQITGFPQQANGFVQQVPGQFGGVMPPQPGFGQQQFQNSQQPSMPFINPQQQQAGGFQSIIQQPTGFQPGFQQPQATGINAFLPPALQPQPTGVNGFGQQQQQLSQQTFSPPPIPPMSQLSVISPLQPQKTGPAPPVRFGVLADAKKLAPQPTGRRANLSQATPQNPFGF